MPADQPTLSAEQMAEVRAACTVLSEYSGDDGPWDAGYISMMNEDDNSFECEAVATILNAAPALLALAEECERLRSQCEELRARLRGLTGICEP